MSRCRVGPKKVASKIAPLVPTGDVILDALTNRGHHYVTLAVKRGDRVLRGTVNYHNGVAFEPYDNDYESDNLPYAADKAWPYWIEGTA